MDTLKIKYTIDSNLVRGLDYYSRTTFEIIAPSLGAQNAICGGGRYDKLIEMIGGKPTPGIGFALGIERLLLLLEAVTNNAPQRDGITICSDSNSIDFALTMTQQWRDIFTQLSFTQDLSGSKLGK